MSVAENETDRAAMKRARVWWLLVFILANDVSYFARSSSAMDFLGGGTDQIDAIGFPLLIWEEGGFAGRVLFGLPGLLVNIAVGAFIYWRGPDVWRPSARNRICGTSERKRTRASTLLLAAAWLWFGVLALLLAVSCRMGFYAVALGTPAALITIWAHGNRSRDVPLSWAIAGVLALFVILRSGPPEVTWELRMIRLFVSWSGQWIVLVLVRDWLIFLRRITNVDLETLRNESAK
jgi:hypothetical protein